MNTPPIIQTTVLAIRPMDAALSDEWGPSHSKVPEEFEIRNLGHAFLAATLRNPAATAFVSPRCSQSYGQLLAAVWCVRDRLLASPAFEAHARVVLLLNNSPEYAAAFYGTLLAGGVVVPVAPDAMEARLADICRSCESKILLTSDRIRRRRTDLCCCECDIVELAERNERLNGADGDGRVPFGTSADLDDLAAIFFTAGSSGLPKGVMLSHRNLISNSHSICQYLGIDSNERALAILPFHHAFGNSVLHTHLLSGATLVLDGSPTFPESILEGIRRHSVTSLSGVPDLFHFLLNHSSLGESCLPSLRYMAVAGGALRPELALNVAHRIAPAQFVVMYGQTEATARLSYLPPDKLASRAGSIGKGIPGIDIQVVSPDGRSVDVGETGEVRARGPNVMLGYWRDETSTAETIRDGWLYTGDLATVDSDGMIYPLGRHSALIKVRGFRVHPREIEDFATAALPVQQAVVVPYESADGATRIALFVRSTAGTKAMATGDLLRSCTKQLPRHMVPDVVQIVDEFPLNDALKIDRSALSQTAAEAARWQTRVSA